MNIKAKLVGVVSTLSTIAYVGVGSCSAAADADLTAAISSSTEALTDNKAQIVAFFAAVIVALLLVGLAKGALMWGKRAILSIWGGRRKRR